MLPPLRNLRHLFDDPAVALQYLIDHQVFYAVEACGECDAAVTYIEGTKQFQCRRKACRKKVSLFSGSLFSQSRIPCSDVLFLAYLWLARCPTSSIITISGRSSKTIVNFIDNFRLLVTTALDENATVIGGDGVIVEIDESKFGKRKYNRGHRVEGAWVIGGVERTDQRRVFLQVIERRDADTILDVIQRHVAPGFIIHTDMWRGYAGIGAAFGIEHRTVNHAANFFNPEDGTHTNTIEGMWNGIKLNISLRNRNRDRIDDFLMEYI